MPDILVANDHPLFRDALQRAVLVALPQAQVRSAAAYIPKSTAGESIVRAIRAMLDGDRWRPPQRVGGRVELQPDEAGIAARVATLTPQQFRVMTMIAEGLLNEQIA